MELIKICECVINIHPLSQGDLKATFKHGKIIVYNSSQLKVYRGIFTNYFIDNNIENLTINKSDEYKLVCEFGLVKTIIPPDLDKLVRGVCDILTQNNLIYDDANITDIQAKKVLVPDKKSEYVKFCLYKID